MNKEIFVEIKDKIDQAIIYLEQIHDIFNACIRRKIMLDPPLDNTLEFYKRQKLFLNYVVWHDEIVVLITELHRLLNKHQISHPNFLEMSNECFLGTFTTKPFPDNIETLVSLEDSLTNFLNKLNQ